MMDRMRRQASPRRLRRSVATVLGTCIAGCALTATSAQAGQPKFEGPSPSYAVRASAGTRGELKFTLGPIEVSCARATAKGNGSTERILLETLRFGGCEAAAESSGGPVRLKASIEPAQLLARAAFEAGLAPEEYSFDEGGESQDHVTIAVKIPARKCVFYVLAGREEATAEYANEEVSTRNLHAFPEGFQAKVRATIALPFSYSSTGACGEEEGLEGSFAGTLWIESPKHDLFWRPAEWDIVGNGGS